MSSNVSIQQTFSGSDQEVGLGLEEHRKSSKQGDRENLKENPETNGQILGTAAWIAKRDRWPGWGLARHGDWQGMENESKWWLPRTCLTRVVARGQGPWRSRKGQGSGCQEEEEQVWRHKKFDKYKAVLISEGGFMIHDV